MKVGILILWPMEIVFVVRWEFWLLLLQEMTVKTMYLGAQWPDRPWLLVSLCVSGPHLFLITVMFLGTIYCHFPFVRFFLNYSRNCGKVGIVSIFPLSGICPPMAYVLASF